MVVYETINTTTTWHATDVHNDQNNVESGLVRGLSRIGRARDTGETTARLAWAGVFPALPFKDTAKSHNSYIWIMDMHTRFTMH